MASGHLSATFRFTLDPPRRGLGAPRRAAGRLAHLGGMDTREQTQHPSQPPERPTGRDTGRDTRRNTGHPIRPGMGQRAIEPVLSLTELAAHLFVPPQTELAHDRLRQASGIFPTGVVAVAADVDGLLVGLAASSFTSVSLDPPLVSFSIARASKTWPDLRRSAHVGVTVLADHQGAVCRQLAGRPARRFDGVPVRVTDSGAVTLDEGSPGSTAR